MIEGLGELLNHVDLKDLLDLGILWFLIYRILVLTERSGATRIFVGMAFMGGLYFLSDYLELQANYWILDNFFSNLVVIMVVLFQKEIRRLLSQLGESLFLKSQNERINNEVAHELSQSLIKMCKNKWGAIVVVEKSMNIDSHIDEGVLLDARLSQELLLAIFNPEAPFHDGAVLIRNGKIFSAGNFLPLSKNPLLDKNLGSRHRAALGLSEVCDALIFLVSEERKSINLIYAGQLTEVKDLTEGKDQIQKWFVAKR